MCSVRLSPWNGCIVLQPKLKGRKLAIFIFAIRNYRFSSYFPLISEGNQPGFDMSPVLWKEAVGVLRIAENESQTQLDLVTRHSKAMPKTLEKRAVGALFFSSFFLLQKAHSLGS